MKVAVLMGSPRDKDKLAGAVNVLANFGVDHDVLTMSAHRNPEEVAMFSRTASRNGYEAIIAAAGMSNALSGVVAAHCRLPVYGVPLSGGNSVHDLASFFSTSEMPPGIPVAGVAIDGAANAALLAIRQLSRHNPVLDRKLRGFMERGSNVRAPMPIHSGKVRDTFKMEGRPDLLLQWTSDRLSAFDWVLEDPIPGKGEVLTRLTEFWLTQTPLVGILPNHLAGISLDQFPEWSHPLATQVCAVKRLDMVKLECIVRGYLEGSAWREYERQGTMHGEPLPVGMQRCQKLPEPVFTPSTKAEEGQNDQNINFGEAAEFVGHQLAERVRETSLKLYKAGEAFAADRGIMILDTKFEFGLDLDNGDLVLADEVFTPDSSRFVATEDYRPGQAPQSMDKEYVRQWLLNESGWDKDSGDPPPPLPPHVIWETARRYQNICDRLTQAA